MFFKGINSPNSLKICEMLFKAIKTIILSLIIKLNKNIIQVNQVFFFSLITPKNSLESCFKVVDQGFL